MNNGVTIGASAEALLAIIRGLSVDNAAKAEAIHSQAVTIERQASIINQMAEKIEKYEQQERDKEPGEETPSVVVEGEDPMGTA